MTIQGRQGILVTFKRPMVLNSDTPVEYTRVYSYFNFFYSKSGVEHSCIYFEKLVKC